MTRFTREQTWQAALRSLAYHWAIDSVLLDLTLRAASLTSSCTMLLGLIAAPDLITDQFDGGPRATARVILMLPLILAGEAAGLAHGLAASPRGVVRILLSCWAAWPLIAIGWWRLLSVG